MSRRRDSFTKSLDLFEDRIGRGGPRERVCVGVPFGGVAFDSRDEVFDLAERVTPDGLTGNDVGPSFPLVGPQGLGWGVVNVKSWPPCQPRLDLGMLVRAVIVDNQVNVKVLWHVVLDMT